MEPVQSALDVAGVPDGDRPHDQDASLLPSAASTAAVPPSTHPEAGDGVLSPAQELATVRAEKSALEDQYRALLSKLTTMRNTLGDKLRQDAVRLFPFAVTRIGNDMTRPG